MNWQNCSTVATEPQKQGGRRRRRRRKEGQLRCHLPPSCLSPCLLVRFGNLDRLTRRSLNELVVTDLEFETFRTKREGEGGNRCWALGAKRNEAHPAFPSPASSLSRNVHHVRPTRIEKAKGDFFFLFISRCSHHHCSPPKVSRFSSLGIVLGPRLPLRPSSSQLPPSLRDRQDPIFLPVCHRRQTRHQYHQARSREAEIDKKLEELEDSVQTNWKQGYERQVRIACSLFSTVSISLSYASCSGIERNDGRRHLDDISVASSRL